MLSVTSCDNGLTAWDEFGVSAVSVQHVVSAHGSGKIAQVERSLWRWHVVGSPFLLSSSSYSQPCATCIIVGVRDDAY